MGQTKGNRVTEPVSEHIQSRGFVIIKTKRVVRSLTEPIVTFLNVFRTSIDHLALYPQGNPAVEKQFNNFRLACQELMGTQGFLELEYRDAFLHVNGYMQSEKIQRHPLVRWLQKTLHDRSITKMTLQSRPTIREIQVLARVFNTDPAAFSDPNMAQSLLDQGGVAQIRFNEGAASQERQTAASQKADTGDFFSSPERASHGKIEMSPQEEYTLKHNILALIRNKKLDRVAESLALICRDLYASDRKLREMGVASYRVVVRTLIEDKLEHPLNQVQRGIFRDLDQIEEDDVFAYHLETLHEILDFFKNAVLLRPMIDGMEWLAGRAHRYTKVRRDLISELFLTFLDGPTVDMLIRHIDTNSAFKPSLQKLFTHYGTSFVRPFLEVLYKTESRSLRHAVMRQLQRMGPVIQPDLLRELKRHVDAGGPWFVKRNLLQLLAEQPPVEMVGLLEQLVRENQPKLFDLISRCLFRIAHQDAFQLGKRLLASSPEPEKVKLIAQVGSGKLKAYCGVLVEMIEGQVSDEVKVSAIRALGRLDTEAGVTCLKRVLANKSMFGGKSREQLREAAAHGLAACALPQAREALRAFAGDRNKTVRNIAARTDVSAR